KMVMTVESAAVGERVNFKLFEQASSGSPVRVGGRFSSPGVLTTTDGGTLTVSADAGVTMSSGGFVEVVGTKSSGGQLQASGVLTFEGEVDVELWDEAVRMAHLPQLRAMLFAPAGSA
ncbi:unnamed protein product, partial [Polarella glacialis]